MVLVLQELKITIASHFSMWHGLRKRCRNEILHDNIILTASLSMLQPDMSNVTMVMLSCNPLQIHSTCAGDQVTCLSEKQARSMVTKDLLVARHSPKH